MPPYGSTTVFQEPVDEEKGKNRDCVKDVPTESKTLLPQPTPEKSPAKDRSLSDVSLSMLSNFSTDYNIFSISMALHLMEQVYELSPQDKSMCSSALIAGMVLGQLGGGALGDFLGRHLAIEVVTLLQLFAAFASALSLDLGGASQSHPFPNSPFHTFLFEYGPSISIYHVLAVWRFILGIGCGGGYPLAATLSSESSENSEVKAKMVAWTFSMQGVGYFSTTVAAYVLVSVFGEKSDISWRLLLGFGSIPGLIFAILRPKGRNRPSVVPLDSNINDDEKETLSMSEVFTKIRDNAVHVFEAIRTEKDLIRKILGTGGCWFLCDILFYGNTLFEPVVLGGAFGNAETVLRTIRDAGILAFLAMPGYFATVAAVGDQSPRYIQAQGFLMMTVLYAIVGFQFDSLTEQRWLLLFLYGSTFFFINYGPNTTTFILSPITFSRTCRSTMNGICAACGKSGALLGTMLFVPATGRLGHSTVMLICSGISMFSFFLTLACVTKDIGTSRQRTKDDIPAVLTLP